MRVRREYLLALALVILVSVASLVASRANSGGSEAAQIKAGEAAQAVARRDAPAAMAALQRLSVPADFHRLTRGCRWYRCYVVPRPTPQVAPILPTIMRSIGADNPQTRRLVALMGALAAPLESETLLKHLGVRAQASRVEGCTTIYSPQRGLWVHCTEPAVIDDNVVDVFLAPYIDCPTSRTSCRLTHQTEVDVTGPSGAPQYR